MPPPHSETSRSPVTALPWAQTSFLPADGKTSASPPSDDPSREAMEVLRMVDHAGDRGSQREALDRLAANLTQPARQRGRMPVPKRSI